MPFNLVQIAANGTTLPKQKSVGLFGPVVLISKIDHNKIGGHESVRKKSLRASIKSLRLPMTLNMNFGEG